MFDTGFMSNAGKNVEFTVLDVQKYGPYSLHVGRLEVMLVATLEVSHPASLVHSSLGSSLTCRSTLTVDARS